MDTQSEESDTSEVTGNAGKEAELEQLWHIIMLNDKKRNQVYQQAIKNAVQLGHEVVLDIGSGTGLLSMFAAQAGATKVYGCEENETMYKLSVEIVAANQLSSNIEFIARKSQKLQRPLNIPDTVSLVVTEIFDSGFLREGVLSTLSDAWERLLNKNGKIQPLVIPRSGKVFVTAIESEYIREKNRFRLPALESLNVGEVEIWGRTSPFFSDEESFAESSDNSTDRNKDFSADQDDEDMECPGNDGQSDDSSCSDSGKREPYTGERLANIPGGYRLLTKTKEILRINFNDAKMINTYYKEGHEGDEVALPVIENGELDALAVWFELHLDEGLILSTDPTADSSWDQAIFPVRLEDATCEREDEVVVRGLCGENGLNVECIRINRVGSSTSKCSSPKVKPPNLPKTVISIDEQVKDDDSLTSNPSKRKRVSAQDKSAATDFMPTDLPLITSTSETASLHQSNVEGRFDMTRRHILTVKDFEFTNAYCKAVRAVHKTNSNACYIRDLMSVASTLPIQLAKIVNGEIEVTDKNVYKRKMLKHLSKLNDLEDQVKLPSSKQSDDQQKRDILMTELVDVDGKLIRGLLDKLASQRETSLRPGGVIIPRSARVKGMLIESPFLQRQNCVSDENTLGLKVADYIKKFEPITRFDVHLNSLDHKKLSEPFELASFNFSCNSSEKSTFLEELNPSDIKVCEEGQVTAVIYWFDLELAEGISLCTLNHFWRQAAIIQRPIFEVSTTSKIKAKATFENDYLNVSLEKC